MSIVQVLNDYFNGCIENAQLIQHWSESNYDYYIFWVFIPNQPNHITDHVHNLYPGHPGNFNNMVTVQVRPDGFVDAVIRYLN